MNGIQKIIATTASALAVGTETKVPASRRGFIVRVVADIESGTAVTLAPTITAVNPGGDKKTVISIGAAASINTVPAAPISYNTTDGFLYLTLTPNAGTDTVASYEIHMVVQP